MAFNPNTMPPAARNAFYTHRQNPYAWMLVVQECIKAGMTNADELASIVFYFHHPERGGRSIEAGEKALIDQWKAFRDLIKPLVSNDPASNKPSKFPSVTSSEYIRWVKASLNRVLGTTLVDNAVDTLEYRYWIKEFQINQHLPPDGMAGKRTQDALMKRSRYSEPFVEWVQRCLNRSGEAEGKLSVSRRWNDDTTHIVKIFQMNEETRSGEPLKDDGWVGVKTEWALYRRTRIPPPGRYKIPPSGDKPIGGLPKWSDPLSPELRAKTWLNGLHIMITTNPHTYPDPDERRQMFCFLEKLRANSGYDFAYLTKDAVNKFVNANQLRGGYDADDISIDAKHEILKNIASYAQKKDSYWEGWLTFKFHAFQTFIAVTAGLNQLKEFVHSDEFAADPGVRHLRSWVENRQKKEWSILSCFT